MRGAAGQLAKYMKAFSCLLDLVTTCCNSLGATDRGIEPSDGRREHPRNAKGSAGPVERGATTSVSRGREDTIGRSNASQNGQRSVAHQFVIASPFVRGLTRF